MRKSRIVKPSLFTDAKTGRWPPQWWALYIGCMQVCDVHGRMPGTPEFLAAGFPFWRDALEHSRALLTHLVKTEKAIEYEVDGEPYLWLRSFPIHQRLDKRERNPQPDPKWWDWNEKRSARQNVTLNLERLERFRRNPDATPCLSLPKGGGDTDKDRDRDRDRDLGSLGREGGPGGGGEESEPTPPAIAVDLLEAHCQALGQPWAAQQADLVHWLGEALTAVSAWPEERRRGMDGRAVLELVLRWSRTATDADGNPYAKHVRRSPLAGVVDKRTGLLDRLNGNFEAAVAWRDGVSAETIKDPFGYDDGVDEAKWLSDYRKTHGQG